MRFYEKAVNFWPLYTFAMSPTPPPNGDCWERLSAIYPRFGKKKVLIAWAITSHCWPDQDGCAFGPGIFKSSLLLSLGTVGLGLFH